MENKIVTEEKARELRDKYLGGDLAGMLTQETPEELIDSRQARGGSMVRYVAGHHFIIRLNECFGFLWGYDVPEQFELNGQIVAKGQLTVSVPVVKKKTTRRFIEDGKQIEEESVEYERWDIKKTQFGSSEIKRYSKDDPQRDKQGNVVKDRQGQPLYKHRAGDVIDLGDDYKGAGTDAMKKCATQFGMFLDVYASRASEEEGGVSKEQYKVFYWRAEEAGMNEEQANKWASEKLEKPFKDIDQLEVMGLIPALMDLKKEKENEEAGK